MDTTAPPSLEAAYRALDPQGALEPGASAYTPRPVAPLATLAAQLRLDRRAGLHLVSGHVGSGKTTELRRLAAELGPAARAEFVAVDAASPDGKLSSLEIAGFLLETLQRADQQVALASAAADLRSEPPHRNDREREQHIIATLVRGLEWSRDPSNESQTPPIVLLDGLDKLSLSEIELTIARMLSWSLPFSLVATVPLSYLFTPAFSRREGGFAGVHVVPALPVVNREWQANTATLTWFSSVLVSRGVRDLFDDVAIDKLATMTAGIIRDFVRSCREAVLTALVQGRSRVDLEMAKIALDEFALRMTRPVSGDDLRVLNVVAETGRVVGHSTFLALIDGGQIVEYRNGANWYAVHPLLRDIVARFAEEIAS